MQMALMLLVEKYTASYRRVPQSVTQLKLCVGTSAYGYTGSGQMALLSL